MTARVSTPEHDKLLAVAGTSRAIGEFVDWLAESGIVLAEQPADAEHLLPVRRPLVWLLAEHFGIDLDAIDNEKRALLASIGGTP